MYQRRHPRVRTCENGANCFDPRPVGHFISPVGLDCPFAIKERSFLSSPLPVVVLTPQLHSLSLIAPLSCPRVPVASPPPASPRPRLQAKVITVGLAIFTIRSYAHDRDTVRRAIRAAKDLRPGGATILLSSSPASPSPSSSATTDPVEAGLGQGWEGSSGGRGGGGRKGATETTVAGVGSGAVPLLHPGQVGGRVVRSPGAVCEGRFGVNVSILRLLLVWCTRMQVPPTAFCSPRLLMREDGAGLEREPVLCKTYVGSENVGLLPARTSHARSTARERGSARRQRLFFSSFPSKLLGVDHIPNALLHAWIGVHR